MVALLAGSGSPGSRLIGLCTVQERRLKAERTGQMIDLTKDVSPAVLAQTAAKLEAEQKERDEDEAQRELAEARKPFEARLVSCLQIGMAVLCLPAIYLCAHVGLLAAHVGLHRTAPGTELCMLCMAVCATQITHALPDYCGYYRWCARCNNQPIA